MNAGISKIGTTIAITGTLLLWSNSFEHAAERLKDLLHSAGVQPEPGYFDTAQRLKLVYYGGFSILLSWALYKWRCPHIIQRHPATEDYLSTQAQIHDSVHLAEAFYGVGGFIHRLKDGSGTGDWTESAPPNVRRGMNSKDLFEAMRSAKQIFRPGGETRILTERRSVVFRAYHMAQELKNPIVFWACAIFGIAGLLATFAPTIEVFFLVTRRVLRGTTW
jgi:hypothetical protein